MSKRFGPRGLVSSGSRTDESEPSETTSRIVSRYFAYQARPYWCTAVALHHFSAAVKGTVVGASEHNRGLSGGGALDGTDAVWPPALTALSTLQRVAPFGAQSKLSECQPEPDSPMVGATAICVYLVANL